VTIRFNHTEEVDDVPRGPAAPQVAASNETHASGVHTRRNWPLITIIAGVVLTLAWIAGIFAVVLYLLTRT
jgi:hypothetical protein